MVSAKRRITRDKIVGAALRGIKKAQAKDLGFLDWIYEVKTELRGIPFSFAGHEYLREIYEVHHDDECYMKGAQVGISTYHLLKALWLCDTHHAKVIYFFPTDGDVSDFSNDRCRPMIVENEYLKGRVSGIDNVGLKQLGDSSIYFRGMVSRLRVKSVDADYVVLDELDEARPENIKFAQDRLLHSQLHWHSQLSQPSVLDFGIHRAFKNSDQRVWSLQCARCNHWNFFDPNQPNEALEYADKFLYQNAWHCTKCGRPLEVKKQGWIALFPNRRQRRGYHLTQLYSQILKPKMIADEINEARERKIYRMRVFNSIFGIPYSDEINQPVNDEVINQAQRDQGFASSSNFAFMGIDVGDLLHIVIGEDMGEHTRIVHLEITEDWGRLKALMLQFSVWQAVIDAMPYKVSAKEFARHFENRVCLQYFKSGQERGDLFEQKTEDDVYPVVRVARTESLDDTTDQIRQGKVIFPSPAKLNVADLHTYEVFKGHLKNLIKDFKEDEKGGKWFEYKHNVENHFGMALNSMRVAIEYNKLYGRRFYGAGVAFTEIKP